MQRTMGRARRTGILHNASDPRCRPRWWDRFRDDITLHKNNAGTRAADIAIATVDYREAKNLGPGRWMDLAPMSRE